MPEESAAPLNADSMDEKPCSSSSATESPRAVMEEAKKLIGTGNRHMVMGDVVSAVAVFQEACSMLAKKYGDTADECGEAFFLCGKALLDMARMENTVLGNALDGVPEEESEEAAKQDDSKIESADNLDEETRDELRVQVYDAMSEKEGKSEKGKAEGSNGETEAEVAQEQDGGAVASSAKESGTPPVEDQCSAENNDVAMEEGNEKTSEEGEGEESKVGVMGTKATDGDNMEEKVENTEEAGDDSEEEEEEEEEEEQAAEGKESDGEEGEEEEVGNLQLAWEMLEVAKVIYKRKESKEDQLLAAQAHLKLGEVGTESGNYSQALEDFQECLSIQLKHLAPHSRLLAETHYQLGLTYGYTGQYSKAIQHFNSSIQVIESRLEMLQETLDKAGGKEGAAEEHKEMEELRQLLPDIREKVEDAKESQKTAVVASEAIQQTLAGGSSSGFSAENGGSSSEVPVSDGASTSKAVSDISHLVRKKRKPEESPVKNGDSKKAKQEASVNGNGDSVHNGSGTQEAEDKPAEPVSPLQTSA
ncbi:histone-binding protein N1/N2-like isoform X1 [Brienomyrus brachyistius]|uniref:histone-binding protein N1/N2-like isoform X1 n=1 Tax=Brienomyrus brachyistius TaxID=42636 RepID=UPI0020B3D309|nr:histone-binding protein N1/N2-like isoform X1 [Brienomyrus brachyistius]